MDAVKEILRLHGKKRKLNKGESIFDKLGKYGSLIFIEDGLALKGHYHDNEVVYTDIVGPCEFISLREFFTSSINIDFAVVHTEYAICYTITLDRMKELLIKDVKVRSVLEKMFGKEIELYEQLYLDWSRRVAQDRILKLLIRLDLKYGRDVGVERIIEVGLTHTDFGNLAQSSRQTVTTLLNKLRDENLIFYDRRRILIRDINKLKMVFDD